MFIFMFVCMALTAISEFGPQQWVGLILAKSGAQPMLHPGPGDRPDGRGPLVRRQHGRQVRPDRAYCSGSATFGLWPPSAIVYPALRHPLDRRPWPMWPRPHLRPRHRLFWPNMIGFVVRQDSPKSGRPLAQACSVIGAGLGECSPSSIFQPHHRQAGSSSCRPIRPTKAAGQGPDRADEAGIVAAGPGDLEDHGPSSRPSWSSCSPVMAFWSRSSKAVQVVSLEDKRSARSTNSRNVLSLRRGPSPA